MVHSEDTVIDQARRIVLNAPVQDALVKGLFDQIMMDDGITSYKKLPSAMQRLVNINPQQFKVFVTDDREGTLVCMEGPPFPSQLDKTTTQIRSAVMADLEWFRGAPCVTDLSGCAYLSGTPMYFLPPYSVIFGLRNGNEDSERVGAVNSVIQDYFKNAKWTTLECQPGIPCIARCPDGDDQYSFIRAIVVNSSEDNSFECVCLDINATVTIDAEDIGPLPDCLSVKKLFPSCFVGKLRGISGMDEDNQTRLRDLIKGYINNAEDQVTKPLPSACFGLHKGDYIADWVDLKYNEWISVALLNSNSADPGDMDLPAPAVEDAVDYIQEMEASGQFKFAGLEWGKSDDESANVEESVVQPQVSSLPPKEQKPIIKENDDSSGSSLLDDNAPVDIDIEATSAELQQCRVVNASVNDIQSASVHVPRDTAAEDPAAQFLKIFKNIVSQSNGSSLDHLFIANSLAFASCARVALSNGNWDAVITEIQEQL